MIWILQQELDWMLKQAFLQGRGVGLIVGTLFGGLSGLALGYLIGYYRAKAQRR